MAGAERERLIAGLEQAGFEMAGLSTA